MKFMETVVFAFSKFYFNCKNYHLELSGLILKNKEASKANEQISYLAVKIC